MSLTRKVLRRAPRVFVEADGSVTPHRHQHSKVLRVKPLDVTYRRLVRRALKPLQTRNGHAR